MIMIKGAKMPDGCVDCPCLNEEHLMFCQVTNHSLRDVDVFNERPKDCPIIALPPHGRLIDADKLKDYFSDAYKLVETALHGVAYLLVSQAYDDLLRDIDNAPTIIEAEEDE